MAVVAVVLLSAITALMRGFISEVLAVSGWIGAAMATLYAFPRLQPYMRAHVEPQVLADGMAIAGVFIGSLIVFTAISHEIAKAVRGSPLSAIDRSLGFLFGIVRGGIIVSIAWMLIAWLVPAAEQPDWLRDARSRPYVETGAAMIQSLVPAQMRSEAAAQAEAARDMATQKMQDAEALRRLTTPKPEAGKPAGAPPGAAPGDPAYKKQDRGDLDRLIRNSN